ncbi:MAG: hypothetical protein GZ087_15670 [Flavobacterium sp.]|nr:hypothetical protein [Flavobacterium sp.]
MTSLYQIAFLVFCFVIIRRLFSLFNNRVEAIESCNDTNYSNIENDFSVEYLDDNDFTIIETTAANEKNGKPISITKNTFLYPDDDFGIMIKGKVYNSIVYDYEINDNSSKDKMKIITSKKKNKDHNSII